MNSAILSWLKNQGWGFFEIFPRILGPKIFGKKVGETEYLLSAFPLGGYVKLLGESDVEGLSEEDQKRSFSRQPVFKRIMIVAAGPAFNFLLAIVIFTIVYMVGIPTLTSEIGTVQESSVAYEAGLKQGDVIIAIDGMQISRWNRLAETISTSEGRTLKISFNRNGVRQELTVQPKLQKSKNIFGEEVDSYKLGISPAPKTVINGRLEESEHVLEAATLDNPHCAAAAYLEGRTHQMRGRWVEAVADYSRALELEPELAPARLGSAECLSASGRRGPALATWRRLCVSGSATAGALHACVLGGQAERAERLLAEAVAGRRPFVVLAPYEALLQPLRQGPAMRALAVRLQQLHRP